MLLKSKRVIDTENSVNNTFGEFREYFGGIKVSNFHEDLQNTASEVVQKI